jgi:hypothetical protein
MTNTFIDIMQVYDGSNGDATKALYARLEKLGPAGVVAMNLFRACKASARAKVYRGGGYRGMAYEKKDWSLGNLCQALRKDAEVLNIVWGWGLDPSAVGYEHVLYIEIPGGGQVSFHNARRHDGCPDYPSEWDKVREMAPTRICQWIVKILQQELVDG